MSTEKITIAQTEYKFILSEVERITGRPLDKTDSKWNDYLMKLLDAQNIVTKYTNPILLWQWLVYILIHILYVMINTEHLTMNSFSMHSSFTHNLVLASIIFNIILIMTDAIIPSLITLFSIRQEVEFKNIFYRNLKFIQWKNCILFTLASTLMLWVMLPPL